MKKSEMYRVAQIAVLETCQVSAGTKLEILRELMNKEDVAKFVEEQEEKEKANEAL